MRILFGIQGTGHGHISRAREIIPHLREYGDLDILISGYSYQLDLEQFVVKKKRGISLIYNNKGQVSIIKTAGGLRFRRFVSDIRSLPVRDYDMIISDFEPVTSWAAKKAGIPVIGLGHQASFLSPKTPRPKKISSVAEKILRHYAPCSIPTGFHLFRYDTFIEPPVIRKDIRDLLPSNEDHITVYLPAFNDQYLISLFKKIPDMRWDIFSTRTDSYVENGNIRLFKIDNDRFLRSLESCWGVLTSAGFETCVESIFLGKKLMVIPISNQYEQLCNAAALREAGVPVLHKLDSSALGKIYKWIKDDPVVSLPEYCNVPELIEKIMDKQSFVQQNYHRHSKNYYSSSYHL